MEWQSIEEWPPTWRCCEPGCIAAGGGDGWIQVEDRWGYLTHWCEEHRDSGEAKQRELVQKGMRKGRLLCAARALEMADRLDEGGRQKAELHRHANRHAAAQLRKLAEEWRR
jgi:hypothetical protein